MRTSATRHHKPNGCHKMHLNRLWQPAFFLMRRRRRCRQLLLKLNLKVLSHCHSSFVQLALSFLFHFSLILYPSTLIAFKDGIVFYSKIKTTLKNLCEISNQKWDEKKTHVENVDVIKIKRNIHESCWCLKMQKPKYASNVEHLHKLLNLFLEYFKVLMQIRFYTILL